MTKNIDFKRLVKENNNLRQQINTIILNDLKHDKQEVLAKYISDLIENELLQEGLNRR